LLLEQKFLVELHSGIGSPIAKENMFYEIFVLSVFTLFSQSTVGATGTDLLIYLLIAYHSYISHVTIIQCEY